MINSLRHHSYSLYHLELPRLNRINSYLSFTLVLIVVGVVVLLSSVPRAQGAVEDSSTVRHLGIHVGTGVASYREDLLVPLGFHGPALALGGVYTQRSASDLIEVRLRTCAGHLENRYSHEAWVMMQDIRVLWARKLLEHQRYGTFWAGTSLPLQMNNLFLESWDDAHLYWLTAHGLAGALQWETELSSSSRALVRVEIPFACWVSRPPTYRYEKQEPLNHLGYHLSEPNSRLHFETIDTYRNVFLQGLWQRDSGSSLLSIGLEFQYSYCREPEEIWGINTLLLFSYQWRVGG